MLPATAITTGSTAPLPVQAVNLPFLGARVSQHVCFQYLLLDLVDETVKFAVPRWLVSREHFQVGDRLFFYLPFRSGGRYFNQGEVTAAAWDETLDAQRCEARLNGPPGLPHPFYVDLPSSELTFVGSDGHACEPRELVRILLRDLVLRKHGVRVYFGHLVPLFSRLSLFPSDEYAELRQVLLNEIGVKIAANIAALEKWEAAVQADAFAAAGLPQVLDLEALRMATEPEINNELFGATFELRSVRPHLEAIRLLEQGLFLDYNTLVLLYAGVL